MWMRDGAVYASSGWWRWDREWGEGRRKTGGEEEKVGEEVEEEEEGGLAWGPSGVGHGELE
jgi:hypothetical protein